MNLANKLSGEWADSGRPTRVAANEGHLLAWKKGSTD